MLFLFIVVLIILFILPFLAVANISQSAPSALFSQLYLLTRCLVEKFSRTYFCSKAEGVLSNQRVNKKVPQRSSCSLLGVRGVSGVRGYSTSTKSKSTKSKLTKSVFKWYYLPEHKKLDDIILNADLIQKLVTSFWQKIYFKQQDEVLLIQLVLKTGENTFNSISKALSVSYSDFDNYVLIAMEGYNTNYQHYTQHPVKGIFIKYTVLPKDSPRTIQILKENEERKEYNKSESYSLPTTLDLKTWGTIIHQTAETIALQINNSTYIISIAGNIRNVSVHVAGHLLQEFTDEIINLQNDEFIRDDGKVKIYFSAGKEIRREESQKNVIFLSSKSKDNTKPTENFITLDLETRAIGIGENCNLQVVSAVTYDGEKYSTYFINDFKSPSELILRLCTELFVKQNEGKTVYVHNLSGFDAMFIVKTLANNFEDFKIIRKDDKIISLSVSKTIGYTEHKFTDSTGKQVTDKEPDKVKITFADSLLLLPSSLKSLGLSFGVENKGEYDHTKTNFCESAEDFESIRNEILLYNKQDCLVLYQVILKFKNLVYELFKVNIDKIFTISSIALQVYRSNYFPDSKVAKISVTHADTYKKLISGYYGGAVDVYKPISPKDKTLFCYDVNSLYPSVMLNNDMPVGIPTIIKGHIDLHDTKTFGFLKVKVTTPKDLNMPLLHTKINNMGVAPLGEWTGWYFSEELKYAEKLGYKFEIMEGELYERGRIFTDYVKTIYDLRKTFSKDDPKNIICKLLLNSLYGKFGMNPTLTEWSLKPCDVNSLSETTNKKKIISDIVELGENMLIGSSNTHNTWNRPALSKDEAIVHLAKMLNTDPIFLHNELEIDGWNNFAFRKDLSKLMLDPKHLPI